MDEFACKRDQCATQVAGVWLSVLPEFEDDELASLRLVHRHPDSDDTEYQWSSPGSDTPCGGIGSQARKSVFSSWTLLRDVLTARFGPPSNTRDFWKTGILGLKPG